MLRQSTRDDKTAQITSLTDTEEVEEKSDERENVMMGMERILVLVCADSSC